MTADGTIAGADVGLEAVRTLHAMADLVTPMALRVAVTLGVPELLDVRPGTAADLAATCGADPRVLERILDHLASRDVVHRGPDGAFTLTALGRTACDTDEPTARSWLVRSLRMESLAGDVNHSIVSLLDVARSGRTAYEEHHGEPLWGRVARMDTERVRSEFGRLVPVIDISPIREILGSGVFPTVCDVGAGTGRLAYELLSRGLCTHCHVVDLAPMVHIAGELLDDLCPGRFTVTEADFMNDLLPPADLHAVSDVLADWDDPDAVRLLRNVVRSTRPGSAVLVTETVIPSGAGDLFDRTAGELRLAVEMARPNRGAGELAELGRAAGLEPVSTRSGPHRVAVLFERA